MVWSFPHKSQSGSESRSESVESGPNDSEWIVMNQIESKCQFIIIIIIIIIIIRHHHVFEIHHMESQSLRWQTLLVFRMLNNNYFASSDPHRGIQFIPSDNLSGISIWHSIWHVFWHFIWHIFWPSTWHISSSDILSGISSDILSGIFSDILSAISSDILSDILSGISSDILSGIFSDILSGTLSDVLPGILFGISFGILSGGWSLAGNTGSGWSRLRSSREHLAWMVVVEVRRRRKAGRRRKEAAEWIEWNGMECNGM